MRGLLPAGLVLLLATCASATREAGPSRTLSGPLAGEPQASCVEAYSPEAIAGRGFAFDGTVVSIGRGRTDRPGLGALGLAGVTFEVHQWYVGGRVSTFTVDLPPPGSPGDRASTAESPPAAYNVGTRLLVSGESRWGEPDLADAIAWGCGFTRYQDEATAAAWAAATRAPAKS